MYERMYVYVCMYVGQLWIRTYVVDVCIIQTWNLRSIQETSISHTYIHTPYLEGEIATISTVFEFPPSESCKTRVSLLSLLGNI